MNKKQRNALDRISLIAKIGFVRRDVMKRERERLGLTLAAAAELAGMKTPVQWHDIESGKTKDPQLSTFLKIATALRLDPMELLRKKP